MSFEEQLVRSCSPTLAGLKTGNLFRYRCQQGTRREIGEWDQKLKYKGIRIKVIRREDEYVLLYVYRSDMLENDLGDPNIRKFLSSIGYDCSDIDGSIKLLRHRMCNEDFPHEVGLFLGYPLHDVLGFIDNCGRDCRFCGCWKVYDNEHQTREQFIKFKECQKEFVSKFHSGVGLTEMIV